MRGRAWMTAARWPTSGHYPPSLATGVVSCRASPGGTEGFELNTWGEVDAPRVTAWRQRPSSTSCFSRAWFSRPRATFLAGAKLPPANASLQSGGLRWSSVATRCQARQISNHTSCSSHICKRRQQVEGLAYFSGKSCQRAPARQRIEVTEGQQRRRQQSGPAGDVGMRLFQASGDTT